MNLTYLLTGTGLQYRFGKAAAPSCGPGVEVLHVSPAEALFSAASSLLPVGPQTTHSADVAQSTSCYPLQGT